MSCTRRCRQGDREPRTRRHDHAVERELLPAADLEGGALVCS
ncbi:hypothetical protein [Modestobacter marinus]|uniref:Uncharacterized protein n=1 Tax=Modestobacter marinus TaxID=477641 RepID=A0A846LPZ5_9ACTN|nr:hypothetical protein [Modestobacter marinus]NIH68292.1 hypothetical protein [Modestobacter marinus]